MRSSYPAIRKRYPDFSHVFDPARIAGHERADGDRVDSSLQPSHQVEDMPSVVDEDATAATRRQAPSAARARARAETGRSGAQAIERDVDNLAQPAGTNQFVRDAVCSRVFPVVYAHQHT